MQTTKTYSLNMNISIILSILVCDSLILIVQTISSISDKFLVFDKAS